jgi:hypothetical protein
MGSLSPFPGGIKYLIDPADLRTPLETHADSNLASEFYSRLQSWITQFDESLDNEHEVGVRLVSFGQSVQFHLHSISYWNPSLISFTGTADTGEPIQLIQHVSQISILLMKVARQNPSQPKQKIGFTAGDRQTEEANGE